MDPSHARACVTCHRGDPTAEDEGRAHEGLIADPGDLSHAEETCGKCHPEEARRVKWSSMGLAPRMINHTRFAFGATETPAPTHATVSLGKLEQIPLPSESKNLGDDLLRRSCLRCHLRTQGSERWGEHRGKGCSACHIAYANSADGRPRSHAIVRTTGMTACLKCHNANHVGVDFVGLFEKDFQRGFKSPFIDGRLARWIYGSEQHRLAPDVHFRAGMQCVDCHTLDEIHGTGEPPDSPYPGVGISCRGCHVEGTHPLILKQSDGLWTLLRGKGRTIPQWKDDLIPHRIAEHREKVSCAACHAAWSFQDYGLHLMLEERAAYWKWASLSMQNDPQIQEILGQYTGTYADFVPPQSGSLPYKPVDEWKPPKTKDWLSGEVRPGAWFRGLTARRWEDPPLGVDHRGKVSVMRPIYQYVVSHVDEEENLLLDRHIPVTGAGFPALIFNPYTPHTTSPVGRPCGRCHGNPKAAGLGLGVLGIRDSKFHPTWTPETQIPGHSFRWDALVDSKHQPVQRSTRPNAGPLDAATIETLMNPSSRQRALHYRYLHEVLGRP